MRGNSFALSALLLLAVCAPEPAAAWVSNATVARVIDGDTFETLDGTRFRLIGMDTPELPSGCFGFEAQAMLEGMIGGRRISYETGEGANRDQFGRVLAYVYTGAAPGAGTFVNEFLVERGFARVATFPPNVKHEDDFEAAELRAQQRPDGVWRFC